MAGFWDEDEKLEEYLDDLKDTGANQDDTTTERRVEFDLIYRNDFNRDADKEIEELAENIKALKVLLHNLVVRDDGKGKFMLISGERRWRALTLLKKTDPEFFNNNFATLTCKVIGKNVDMLNLRAMSYSANRQVAPTPEEDAKDLEDMRVIHAQMKERGDSVDENFYKYIAKLKNKSERQIQKVVAIEDFMIPELKDWYYKGAFDTNTATVVAHYDEAVQKEALRFLATEGDKLSKENAEYLKDLNDQLKKEFKETFDAVTSSKIILKNAEIKEKAGIKLTTEEKESVNAANECIKCSAKALAGSVKEIKKEADAKAKAKKAGKLDSLTAAVAKLKGKKLTDAEKAQLKELIEIISEMIR